MPGPVSTLTLGGTDISAYVSEERGPVVRWGRGASFDGATEAPGFLTAIVQNPDRRFSPLNSGSPFAALLRFGKPVRLTAVHSATTYYLFDGFLRRIVPRDDGFAELHCQDALYHIGRREASLLGNFQRSIKDFRSALLADIGITTVDLATAGGEGMVGWTAADQQKVLALLAELNRASGSVHFIKPTSTGYNYKTIDRTAFQNATSAEDWLDTDLVNPFAEALNGSDYNDERIINSQRVYAKPREALDGEVVWQRSRFVVNASETDTFWARFDQPVLSPAIEYETVSGSPTVVVTPFGDSAKIAITAGAATVDLRDMKIRGQPVVELENISRLAEDPTSIATYGGRYRGDDVESRYLASGVYAKGLAEYIVWRNKDASLIPAPQFVNRFPTQLARDIGDVVRITSAEMGTTLARFVIRAFQSEISSKGQEWKTKYQLEALPAAMDLFTVGGTAGQGVGGTGVLAY